MPDGSDGSKYGRCKKHADQRRKHKTRIHYTLRFPLIESLITVSLTCEVNPLSLVNAKFLNTGGYFAWQPPAVGLAGISLRLARTFLSPYHSLKTVRRARAIAQSW